MMRAILRHFGFLKVQYGYALNRHYIAIDGHMLADSQGAEVRLPEIDVVRLGRAVIPGCAQAWCEPNWQLESDPGRSALERREGS